MEHERAHGATDRLLGEERLGRLIAAGTALVSERDPAVLRTRLLEAARALTSARHATLDVRAAGAPARGGADGVLAVPIRVDGAVWGDLRLTSEPGRDFDTADRQVAATLAAWAGIAIEHVQLLDGMREHGDRLERAVRDFATTTTITRAVGAETRLDRVLGLIVERGRALVGARALLILLQDDGALQIAAGAGQVDPDAIGRRIPVQGTTATAVLRAVQPERVDDVAARLRVASERLGVPVTADRLGLVDPRAALIVPLELHGRKLGVLVAFDHAEAEAGAVDHDPHALLLAFAAAAATAVATAQSAERQRLRERIAAAEHERRRWAHELHDQTLQSLAGFRLLVDVALQQDDPVEHERTLRALGTRVDAEIAQLRALIAELRPAALDEQGLRAAIEHLARQVADSDGIEVATDVALDAPAKGGEPPSPQLAPDVETAVYRVVQEALTNVVKHARASRVAIGVRRCDGGVEVTVADDGAGFDPDAPRAGYGLAGMHERAELAEGTLAIDSRAGAGTTVRAWLGVDQPTARQAAAGSNSPSSSA